MMRKSSVRRNWNLVVGAVIAVFAFVPIMNGQNNGDVQELMQTLGKAYQNSVMHDAPSADLTTDDLQRDDLRLENSSIVFSLHLLDEVGKRVCQSSDPATPTVVEQACPLDEQLAGLNALSDSLSYAASRLGKISDQASGADPTNPEQSLFVTRIRSMEHLYRLVFALSHIYLDSSQSAVYLEAADEQLQLANSSIENERALCSCDAQEFAIRLQGLSQLSDRITSLRRAFQP
jgi:hypothetical protein